MRSSELLKIGTSVLEVMAELPKARDDDMYLILKVWSLRHPSLVFMNEQQRPCVRLVDIHEAFESPETIRRTRQKIQNDLGIFPPTSAKVAKARRMREETWREALRNDFNLSQSKAILEIYTRVKGKNKKSITQIKQEILAQYYKGDTLL